METGRERTFRKKQKVLNEGWSFYEQVSGHTQNPHIQVSGYTQNPHIQASGYTQNPHIQVSGYTQNPLMYRFQSIYRIHMYTVEL